MLRKGRSSYQSYNTGPFFRVKEFLREEKTGYWTTWGWHKELYYLKAVFSLPPMLGKALEA